MFREFSRQWQRGGRIRWITGIVVFTLILFLCVGAAASIQYFSPNQEELPEVASFVFNTSTPEGQSTTSLIGTLAPAGDTTSPTLVQPLQPAATPTIFSLYTWLFPQPTATAVPPTPRPLITSTPIQVVVIPPTATNQTQPSPSPQPSPNPTTCKNILYPARAGSQWTYVVNSPVRNGQVVMQVVSVDGQIATVDAFESGTDSQARTYVQCDQDVILNFPLLSGQKVIGSMVNGAIAMDYVGGVLAPNEAAFTANNWALSWKIQYSVHGNGTAQFRGQNVSFELTPSIVEMTCQTLGSGNAAFESITVSAGTFNALKVICRGDGNVSAAVNGSQVNGTISAQATQWFAPNVGLLRSQSDYVNLNVFGISIPLSAENLTGSLELQNYSIGQ